MQEFNILEPYREEFWKWFRKQKITLHPDFHHLSSSQAMCFNLFLPFVAEEGKDIQKLREVFAVDGVIREAQFEKILNEKEATNFDFCITADSRILFELKLTEEAFGGAASDESHLSKFERIYSPALAGKFNPAFCSSDVFFQHYQIMRNVWNLETSTVDKLVCVVPKANFSLARDIAFLDSCLSDTHLPRVSVAFLEDVVKAIEENIPDSATRMREHFREFRQKYLPEPKKRHPFGGRGTCDVPECNLGLDRNGDYCCGGQPDGGRKGCGAFICERHQVMLDEGEPPKCERCDAGLESWPSKDL
jgi:hypothetical protein